MTGTSAATQRLALFLVQACAKTGVRPRVKPEDKVVAIKP